MNDTTPEIAEKIHEMMMARSGTERLVMGSAMFDMARRIVQASLPKDLSEHEMKSLLFERIYGQSLENFLEDA
ncbi:MAG: hypothetical protein QOK48_242 [Blastocatellia bacterium]|jgi:hypothetical protein|nr:hypothetical protein [Blastocatellia bacterium]